VETWLFFKMDAGDIFNRGASVLRVVNLTYEDTGLPIDLDDLDEIQFEVLHAVTSRILGTYTLTGGTVTILDAAAGSARFIVPQSVSALAKLGEYLMIATTEETDVNYEDNTHVRKGMSFCFKLQF